MRSSRVLALSKERDELEWQEYVNDFMKTTRRFELIRETHGDKAAQKAFRLHCVKYDPTEGPLNYAVKHNRVDLLKLIIESGKY